MKKSLLVLALASVTAWAGPILVGSGSGLGEFNVLYAQRVLPELVALCRSQSTCSEGVETDLAQLASHPPTELNVQFLTRKELSDKLFVGPQGQDLQVNKDKLFDADGVPWSFSDAVAFWISLASANTTLQSHLSDLAKAQTQTTVNPDITLSEISLVLIQGPISALLIATQPRNVEAQAIEVPFTRVLDCKDSTGTPGAIENLRVQTAQWMSNNKVDGANPLLTITGQIEYSCQGQNFLSQYRVQVETPHTGDDYTINADSLTLMQDRIRLAP